MILLICVLIFRRAHRVQRDREFSAARALQLVDEADEDFDDAHDDFEAASAAERCAENRLLQDDAEGAIEDEDEDDGASEVTRLTHTDLTSVVGV